MNSLQRILHKPFFIRLFNWEYWPFNTVYFCIYPIWLALCLRSRSFFFFNASNPGIEYGGFLMESKQKIYDIIPKKYVPKTILIQVEEDEATIIQKVRENGFKYPLIAKPDIGGRGRGVKKICEESELVPYLKKFPLKMLIQELVEFENELGIFYFRYPGAHKGNISGIVGKKFVEVVGDGKSTIEQLLQKEKRHILQLPNIRATIPEQLDLILQDGEHKILVPYGNHARGALFLDYSHLIDHDLEKFMNEICLQIPDFYYGRLDIRYESLELLKEGKNFSIIELNGAGSEPTHMYDPKNSIFDAWREITKHWRIMWKISRMNHKNGVDYMSTADGIQMFRDNKRYNLILDNIM
ncbi:MAG: D-alanine--D-alanine ligase [Bacteroidetes bacterium]|nr:MAG: D-alanine--D-alanine ligase [Bacteroidota bacterium]